MSITAAKETWSIGGTPSDEVCAQIGVTPNAQDLNKLECRAYIFALTRKLGAPPAGVSLHTKGNPHDFGTYYEAAVSFPYDDETAVAYAQQAEKGLSLWEDAGMWAPVKYHGAQPVHILRAPELWVMETNPGCHSTVEALKAASLEKQMLLQADRAMAQPIPPAPEPLHGIADWGSETTPLQQVGQEPITQDEAGRFDDLWHYARGHLGFYGYLRVAEEAMMKRVGLGLLDLSDYAWRDAYDEHRSPVDVVQDVLEDAGFDGEQGDEMD